MKLDSNESDPIKRAYESCSNLDVGKLRRIVVSKTYIISDKNP